MQTTKLIEAIQNKKILSHQLSAHQRKVIVRYFLEEQSDVSNVQIAKLIGVTDVQVSRIKRDVLRKSTWEIEEIDIKILGVSLKKKKEELQRKAIVKKDYALAWRIEVEFIEKMQSLGFVYREPEHVTHSMNITDFRESKEKYDKQRDQELGFSIN